jgi:hypothetical protein
MHTVIGDLFAMSTFAIWYFEPPIDSGWLACDGQNGRIRTWEFSSMEEAETAAKRESELDKRTIYQAGEYTPETAKKLMKKAVTLWQERRKK